MHGPYLEITTPQGRKQVPLGPHSLTVGRHAENKLVIADPMASRFHCVIEPRPGGWVVRDLNSSNGTLLDGKRITTAGLRPGQVILIGDTKIALVDPSAKPVVAAARPGAEAVDEEDVIELGEDAEVEQLDELEEVEELTEADVVEAIDDTDEPIRGEADLHATSSGTRVPPRPAPSPRRRRTEEDDSAIPIDTDVSAEGGGDEDRGGGGGGGDDDDGGGVGSIISHYEQTLESLADSLPDKPFGENDIALIGARGQVMHAAKEAKDPAPGGKKKKRREAVEVLRLVLLICTRARGTDVHLEPKTDHFQLRIRIDGIMVDVTRMPMEVGVKICALVKVLSDIDISQRTSIQEGHFAAKLPGAQGGKSGGFRRADYRVSFAPAMFGQKLVIRVFDAANAPLKLDNLQLPDSMLEAVRRELQKESGMLLVCGPTGSGKTTTLYALVRSSDVARRNVVTIEDPVEVQIEGVTQIQVDETQGKTFSSLLRASLRQDPDAILVGEIRDVETARTAMQAAITGHLVFSTVHTTNTIGSIFRLLDLGVEPYLVAQGLHLVLAQRLVRQLCQYCKRPSKPTAEQLLRMGDAGKELAQVFVPKGCPRCLGTGYAGRRAFFELLRTTDELRDVITTTRTMEEIKRVLNDGKFVRLEQAGYQLVAEGAASLEEIEAAVGK
jgi:general secretion pathway protein E